MATLAESFLADLGDSSDEECGMAMEGETDVILDDDDVMKDDELSITKNNRLETPLHNSDRLLQHLKSIERASKSSEDDYGLIVTSNELLVQLDVEIAAASKYICDIYSRRFPELERLLPQPSIYARFVQKIQNKTDFDSSDLDGIVPVENVLIIAMAASTTTTDPLDDNEMQNCLHACQLLLDLDAAALKLLDFVEARMSDIAPNVSALCGPRIASRLIGMAGGLETLAKIPAGNIRVLGAKKALEVSGLSRQTTRPHEGMLAETELVQSTAFDLRTKALRLVGDKVALAARIDAFQTDRDDSKGRSMREGIEAQLEKLQEPAKRKEKKALPAPIEKPRKKRGGRRHRKMKERFETTELSKQRNRLAFGTSEEESFGGHELGMLTHAQSGRVRIVSKDTQKLSKIAARKQSRKRSQGASGTMSGIASSLAFTPVQGLELVNPEAAAAKIKAANDKYFGSTQGFSNVKKAKTFH